MMLKLLNPNKIVRCFLGNLITRIIIKKYCRGQGIEVGPGSNPYCNHANTIYADKFGRKDPKSPTPDIICDASSIPAEDNSFDFLLSSHCLEHCPDVLKVLYEWKRVIKPEGKICLILPHGRRTFDKGRTLSTLEHHIEDYNNNVDTKDTTHWEQYEKYTIGQANHLWLQDAKFPDGSLNRNWIVKQGYMHYHVWTQNEMIEILQHFGFRILVVIEEMLERPDSFLIIVEV